MEKISKRRIEILVVGVVISVLALCSYLCYGKVPATVSPQAIEGVLDLREWDSASVVKLDGEWEFYWGQLLEPATFIPEQSIIEKAFYTVPQKWENYKPKVSSNSDGYATYRLVIRLKEAGKYVAFKMPEVATAYKMYINGKLVTAVGVVGEDIATSKAKYLPQMVNFYSERQDIELVIQVSNFAHHKGGIKSSLWLDLGQTGYSLWEKQVNFQVFMLGIFFIMAVYHFGLYALRRKDKPALYFGLLCLLIALRTMTTGEIIIMSMFPWLEWEVLMKLEYLSYYIAVPIFIKFIYHLYASSASSRIPSGFEILGLLFSSVVLLTPVKIFSRTLLWYDLIAILGCIYLGNLLLRAVMDKKKGASSFAVGVFIFLSMVVNDMLFARGMIATCEMVPLGLFIFIFFQALALSTRFSRAYADLEQVSVELGHSNEKIRHILESIMDGFFALDHEARFTYVNKEAQALLQKSQGELLGKIIWDEFPDLKNTLPRTKPQRGMGETAVAFEMYWDRLGLWLEISAYPLQDGLSVFVRNIQERKQAEEKIREYTEMLKEQVRLLDLDPDYTFERGLDGVIRFWSCGAEHGYDWTKEEAVGKVAYTLLNTQFPEPLEEINKELMSNGRWMGELTETKRDGSIVVVRSCWLLKRGVDGKPVGVLELNKDITEQKNMEKGIARLDCLNVIGQMAAGISHEVRNPMTTVHGFLQWLSQKETNTKYKEYYTLMMSELDRATEILNGYLSVAKPREPEFKVQNINEIILSLHPLLQADACKIGKKIMLELGEVPEVLVDGGEIRQLVLNLFRNGLEAMNEKGEVVTISTIVQKGKIVLSVGDEGTGIDKEILSKLGTPFLSTKDAGTGLGLAVCYSIVARHKAEIKVLTGWEGTTFSIHFNI